MSLLFKQYYFCRSFFSLDNANVSDGRYLLTDIMLKFVSQLLPVLLGMKRSPYRSFTGLAIGLRVSGDPGDDRRLPMPFLYNEG